MHARQYTPVRLTRQPSSLEVLEAVPTQAVSFALWPSGQRRTSADSRPARQLPMATGMVASVAPGASHAAPMGHNRHSAAPSVVSA